ncbi:YndM family protein [Priestia megaterium]|uniref:YndM family protein n=1 Tax=Priestia megaterium TaxID=1404 RepID=UPI000471A356|nr:YndM family protein [Priestia megaterium]TCN13989.1 uncharacterized protein DUF2512 [Bacillus sp. BK006]MCM3181859.1 YndM family protein [Priestia megaterium]MCM3194223.1 YndM family protein [Priestia megaterium]MDH3143611.1 YndM family protein [Priestia megaterium]MED4236452.1 YndM family protein [Priestia megaterium]
MNHATLLLIKFAAALIAFGIGLDLFFDATIGDIISFSLLTTVVTYLVVDRIVLPRVGNRDAIIVEFVLTYMSVWIFGTLLLDSYVQIAWGSIISAAIITFAEVFVHRYLFNHIETKHTARTRPTFKRKLAYDTEFAEEQHVENKENPK